MKREKVPAVVPQHLQLCSIHERISLRTKQKRELSWKSEVLLSEVLLQNLKARLAHDYH